MDEALDRLLHRRSYREAFLAGRVEELEVSGEDLAALRLCDPVELERVAVRVREELLRRKHRGSGGLLELYPRTLEAWRESHAGDGDFVELMSRFMESEHFDRYREVAYAGAGICLEEAFFRFCDAEDIGGAREREGEFLAAMMKALLMSPRPDFEVPEEVRRAPGGFFAVSARGEPALYAATGGKLISGAITPFLAELLTAREAADEVAERHGVSPEALAKSIEQLEVMGLLIKENSRR